MISFLHYFICLEPYSRDLKQNEERSMLLSNFSPLSDETRAYLFQIAINTTTILESGLIVVTIIYLFFTVH